MTIRNLEDGDIQECLGIYNNYILNSVFTLEEEALSLGEFRRRCLGIQSRYPFLVLEEEGKVRGYAYLDTFNPRSSYRWTADLSIYVDPSCRGQGYGKSLLDAIEKKALEMGICNIVSIVTTENQGSFLFHRKNGFVLEGTLHDVAKKFGWVVGVYYLRKSIRGMIS